MRPREFDAHPVSFAAAMARGLWRGIGKGVHDGDTLLVFADKGMFDYQMLTIRLLGINTPEIVGTTGAVLARAQAAKDRLGELTHDCPLLFKTQINRAGAERMTFDRYLADVWATVVTAGVLQEVDVAAVLLAEGLGDPLPRNM